MSEMSLSINSGQVNPRPSDWQSFAVFCVDGSRDAQCVSCTMRKFPDKLQEAWQDEGMQREAALGRGGGKLCGGGLGREELRLEQ